MTKFNKSIQEDDYIQINTQKSTIFEYNNNNQMRMQKKRSHVLQQHKHKISRNKFNKKNLRSMKSTLKFFSEIKKKKKLQQMKRHTFIFNKKDYHKNGNYP